MNQIIAMLSLFVPHIASDVFNLTSFAVLSDAGGGGDSFEMIEANLDEYAGGTLDRVVMNKHGVWVRICVDEVSITGKVDNGLVIMTDNDILQTKYIAMVNFPINSSLSISDPIHIVIDNVWTNTGTEISDAKMRETTTIHINDDSDSKSCGTWTSTIKPDNVTVELNCVVVENDGTIITAKCDSETTWPESVFNRILIRRSNYMFFGVHLCNQIAMFGHGSAFKTEGSIPSEWSQTNVTGSGSNLTIGNQLTIMGLPESFVNHWVNMNVRAWFGNNNFAIFVPPDS